MTDPVDGPGSDGDASHPEGQAPGPEPVENQAVPLLEPRDGLPPLIVTSEKLAEATQRLAGGRGPVAVDAERASGFRYGHRAFLVQLRRCGAGTVLIDPVACPDLSGIDRALADTEAVIHAASQDLPCLADLGYRPRQLFDTELAGRLLGYPRVGLGTLVETVLGLTLEKSHSAADWSTRPLPAEWLRYAALDVEVLVELRNALAEQLSEQGKTEWARQEFNAELHAEPPPPRPDPWRRTSGIHRVRSRRGLAVVRELWQERDKIARRRDLSPTRVLPDAAIVEAARSLPGRLGRPGQHPRLQHPRRPATHPGLAPRSGPGQGAARPGAADRIRGAGRRPAAHASLAGPRPGCRRPADRGPGGGRGTRRPASPARGEPAAPRRRTQAGLAAARTTQRAGGQRQPGRLRRPSLAGRPHRAADRRGAAGYRESGGLTTGLIRARAPWSRALAQRPEVARGRGPGPGHPRAGQDLVGLRVVGEHIEDHFAVTAHGAPPLQSGHQAERPGEPAGPASAPSTGATRRTRTR